MRFRTLILALSLLAACESGPSDPVRSTPPTEQPSILRTLPSMKPAFPRPGNCGGARVPSDSIVAVRRSEVVLIRPSDGEKVCTLVTIEQSRDSVMNLALAPDRRTVYFAERGRIGDCPTIYAARIPTGDVRSVVEGGFAPDVSPDGRRLSYNASFVCGRREHRIVARDLRTGMERSWRGDWEGGYGDEARWAPDPRYLFVHRCAVDACSVFLLDTARADELDGDRWPPDRPRFNGISLTDPGITLGGLTVRPHRGTVVFGIGYSSETSEDEHPFLEYDPKTRSIVRLVRDSGGPLDFDPAGRRLLYKGLRGSELFRYEGGVSVRLGRGYYDAAW